MSLFAKTSVPLSVQLEQECCNSSAEIKLCGDGKALPLHTLLCELPIFMGFCPEHSLNVTQNKRCALILDQLSTPNL